jgi:hypothetical protein
LIQLHSKDLVPTSLHHTESISTAIAEKVNVDSAVESSSHNYSMGNSSPQLVDQKPCLSASNNQLDGQDAIEPASTQSQQPQALDLMEDNTVLSPEACLASVLDTPNSIKDDEHTNVFRHNASGTYGFDNVHDCSNVSNNKSAALDSELTFKSPPGGRSMLQRTFEVLEEETSDDAVVTAKASTDSLGQNTDDKRIKRPSLDFQCISTPDFSRGGTPQFVNQPPKLSEDDFPAFTEALIVPSNRQSKISDEQFPSDSRRGSG